MKRTKKYLSIITSILLLSVCCPLATHAQNNATDLGTNFDVVVLASGLTRSFTYTLSDVIWNDYSAFHTALILTVGAGTLSFSVASASSLGENGDILYATAGFIGTSPIAGADYGSGSISESVDVPDVGVGVLFTAIIAAISGPDFPVTMSMHFSLSK
ncbi:MAG: hypothetical protein NTZ51_00730 [Proteobacteria bacterium]|nr:hypothetical protein [Pseudomonadota bacterium]